MMGHMGSSRKSWSKHENKASTLSEGGKPIRSELAKINQIKQAASVFKHISFFDL